MWPVRWTWFEPGLPTVSFAAIPPGHNSSSSNPAGPGQGALRAPCPDPAGGPSSFHTASRHASWPGQRRRLSLHSFFGKDFPLYSPRITLGLDCFAFLPFLSVCQVPYLSSTTRLPPIARQSELLSVTWDVVRANFDDS